MLYPEDSQEWTPWLPVTPAGPHWLWPHPGRARSGGHAGRPRPLLRASRLLSVVLHRHSETVGPPLFRLQLCFPTSSKMIGAWTNLQWITSGKQEHFPPNSFVLEDKRTEGLYKAQKQMSFTEFTIFIHSLQVPLVATDEGVILLRVLFCFSNLQVFCS